jgi:hypothetical protein
MEVMPDLLATEIDGVNPIETVAGMDVGELYRLYGDRLFLTGGIDMSQLLSNGAPDEVRAVCRKAIADAPTGYFMAKLLRFGKNAPYEGETFPFLPCLNSLQRAGIAPGAAL